MAFNLASDPLVWGLVLLALVACWPIAQSLRHQGLHPMAAYLLFVSVLTLVAAPVFWGLILGASALFGPAALEGAVAAVVIIFLSLLPGFAAARWIVRLPQWRQMPK